MEQSTSLSSPDMKQLEKNLHLATKRWAGLGMGSLMGGDMEHGLAKLKVYAEENR